MPTYYQGLSNMPVVCETVDEAMGQKTIKFGVTPIMYRHTAAQALCLLEADPLSFPGRPTSWPGW